MSDNILKHFTLIGGSTFFSMCISIVATPLITRLVTPSDYGLFSMFLLCSQIMSLVLLLGMDQSFGRFYYGKDTTAYKTCLLYTCIKYPIVLFLISMLFGCIVFKFVEVENNFNIILILVLLLNVVTTIIYRFAQLILRLEYDSNTFARTNLLQKVVFILASIPLLFFVDDYDVYILAISNTLAVAVCMFIAIKKYKNIWLLNNIKASEICIYNKQIYCYAYPFIFSFFLTALFNSSDRFILNYFCDYEEVGIYTSALSITGIFALIQSTFNTLWTPMMVKHYENSPADKDYYINANNIITLIMFFIGIVMILFKDIVVLLLGDKFQGATFLLPCLLFQPIMYTISETMVTGLVVMKKSIYHMFVAGGAATISIIGSILLVPTYGSKGAAIANALAYITFMVLRYYFSQKYFYINFQFRNIVIITMEVLLYSIYCTFYEMNVLSIIFGMWCMVHLLTIYKATVKDCKNYIFNWLGL